MKLSDLKINPNNPQKFDNLGKLKASLKDFPKMLNLRPLVYDPVTMQVLGGNKRLICLQELEYKEIPDTWVRSASDLTEVEKQRFIIADNVGFGEWDMDVLNDLWEQEDLEEWGLELIDYSAGHDINNMTDKDICIQDEFDPIGSASDLMKIIFIFDNELDAEKFMSLKHKNQQYKKVSGPAGKIWQINLSTTYGK